MKAVVQRVKNTSLSVEGKLISSIDFGLVVYFCAEQDDSAEIDKKIDLLAKKIANLRIFEDENGKMNLSVLDVKGQILAVSQFTLCGDVRHGNRPSFITAMVPDMAKEGYSAFCTALRTHGAEVKEGIFGADMQINQLNDGPVTIWYDI